MGCEVQRKRVVHTPVVAWIMTSAINVVDAGDDLSWGVAYDDGNGVADSGGNDTDIKIV